VFLGLGQYDSGCRACVQCVRVGSAMRFGRVDTLGQYISEFDPEPDTGKKGIGIHRSLSRSLCLVFVVIVHVCSLVFPQ